MKGSTTRQISVKKDGRENNGHAASLSKGRPPASEELTDCEMAFVENYLFHFNKAQALREAGYIKENAASYANDLMKRPRVKKYLDLRRAEMKNEYKSIHARITNELMLIAFSNTADLAQLQTVQEVRDQLVAAGLSREDAEKLSPRQLCIDRLLRGNNGRLIKSIKEGRHGIEFQLYNKEAALDMLARHTGYYEADNSQRKENPVQIYIPDNGRPYTEEQGTSGDEPVLLLGE